MHLFSSNFPMHGIGGPLGCYVFLDLVLMGHNWRKMWASGISSKCGHRWPGLHELEINTPHEIIWMRYLKGAVFGVPNAVWFT